MASSAAPGQVVDEKAALRAALSIAEGGQLKDSVWGQSPALLQSLLVTICRPSESATSKTLKIRLDAMSAIANQGYSVNGEPGTTTPLHAACASRSIDLASALLAFGADPGAKDGQGRTPQQCIPIEAPEGKAITGMLRSAELKMTAIQAVQTDDSKAEVNAGAKDMLVARAYRSAARKMGI